MKIVFRAVAMMTGVFLLAGLIGLVLLNLALALWPMRTPPVSAEELAMRHSALAATLESESESAPQS